MPRALRGREKRWLLFKKQRGRCFYCAGEMVIRYGDQQQKARPDECTLEHLDSRLDPERGKHSGKRRIVAACRRCNHARGEAQVAALPLEELRRRSALGAQAEGDG